MSVKVLCVLLSAFGNWHSRFLSSVVTHFDSAISAMHVRLQNIRVTNVRRRVGLAHPKGKGTPAGSLHPIFVLLHPIIHRDKHVQVKK